MTKTIVVLGVTGVQGGSVASKFLSTPDWKVRGVTRDASSISSQALAARGVDLIEADLDKPDSFKGIFSGADAIFAVTDFWQPYQREYARLRTQSDRAIGEYAYGVEIARGKVIVDAAADALKSEGRLEVFIWSTLPPMKELSGQKYTYVYHFDSKAEVAKYIASAHPDLHSRTSFLNMGFYLTNTLKSGLKMTLAKEVDGSYTLANPGPKDAVHPLVDPRDAGAFAELLVNVAPGKNLLGCGEMISYASFMKIWSEVIGIPSQVKQLPVDALDKFLPGGLGREICESTFSSAEFGWGKDLILPRDINSDVKLTSVREYIQGENWDPILKRE